MNRYLSTAGVFSTAIGLALALQAAPASAQPQQTAARMAAEHLEKCYGINAVAKNDCAAGVHSCAGQATAARDPKSFVLVPVGVCGKIQGGSTKAL